MKKAISILLSLLTLLVLCSCAKEKGIDLTLENYEDYLVVEENHYMGGDESAGNRSDIVSDISIKGVSSNHIYKDVEVDFRLNAAYFVQDYGPNSDFMGYSDKAIDKIITVKCNVAGDGQILNHEPTGGYINSKMIEQLSCEIVEIRGKVVEN